MGRQALGRERLALRHPEAMLLVDDDEVEPREVDGLLEERVRADHDLRLAGGEGLQGRATSGAAERAGQQRDGEAGVGEQVAHRLGQLPGQQVGRRQEGALAAAAAPPAPKA